MVDLVFFFDGKRIKELLVLVFLVLGLVLSVEDFFFELVDMGFCLVKILFRGEKEGEEFEF